MLSLVTGPPAGGLTQCGATMCLAVGNAARGLPGEPPRLFVVTRSAASAAERSCQLGTLGAWTDAE